MLRRDPAPRQGDPLRVAVVGHVEWAEFLLVGRPPGPGEVVTAAERCEVVGGSGAIVALQLAKLGCDVAFYTRLTDDELGRKALAELREHGIVVEATRSGTDLRRAIVHIDDDGERAITLWGEKRVPSWDDSLPWDALATMDAVCFLAGDGRALRAARAAPVLVSTARWLDVLRSAAVRLDALVGSRSDPAETYHPGDLDPPPTLAVTTDGEHGGLLRFADGREERYNSVMLSSDAAGGDAYGCGDSFIGGLALALARGQDPADAVAFAARCGAACRTGRGLTAQLRA